MKVTAHLRRRIVGGTALAAAAILVPTAALAASGTPASQGAQPAVTCSAANTQVWYAVPGDGTLGSIFYQFEISNIGHTSCSFVGFPGVSALNIHGHEVGKPATRTGSPLTVTLTPGETAHFVLQVVEAGAIGGCTLANASSLRIFAPEQRRAVILSFSSQQCLGKSVLKVDSVHPGTGIPGFTNS